MKQQNTFAVDMADFDQYPDALLWRPGKPTGVRESNGALLLEVPFRAMRYNGVFEEDDEIPHRSVMLTIVAYGRSIVRLHADIAKDAPTGSDMLDSERFPEQRPLSARKTETGWVILDDGEVPRARVRLIDHPVDYWSDQIPPPGESLELILLPDGTTEIPISAWDQFFPKQIESVGLGFQECSEGWASFFSFEATHAEAFAGTGERFSRLNLAGQTVTLENTDALGVNNRRAYKNVPFVLSSRPYGLFVHTSMHTRLSIADVSTRALQGRIEGGEIDLFVIGGGSVQSILYDYRCLTGFPPEVPLWSYGTWMSRMTYFSASEVLEIADRLRSEGFPCDVLHLDTGWFAKDWVCEWTFSEERFPDPSGFMKELRDRGYRVTLWQTPNIGKGNRLLEEAQQKRYVPPRGEGGTAASDFSAQEVGGQIDFTYPPAVEWYQGMIGRLMEMGAAAIKTDFGEKIAMDADYHGMPAEALHNLYGLLYQRAAFEQTVETRGEGIIWARAGWAGCQRYPVHWGGDCACTWDGLAGSIRGGLHLGLSGFGFWSHDVPGFHGIPDFMNSRPDPLLYLRWTQVGVFTSHLRYHGTSAREPYEYPEIADLVRGWWRLRYALIPYLVMQARIVSNTGLPMLRALVVHHDRDPAVWTIDDEYYFGDDILVAPVLSDTGIRDVYLPDGEWVDLWDGIVTRGPVWLREMEVPRERIPVFVRSGAAIPVYPIPVSCTDEIDLEKAEDVVFDGSYRGFGNSLLGRVTGGNIR